jgi:hypothetical protein
MHYDGTDLSPTKFTGMASAIGGTPAEVFIVRTAPGAAPSTDEGH